MTRKTVAALTLEVDTLLADNTVQAITPAVTRSVLQDIIDTYKPGFGAVGNDSLTLTALGVTPVVVTYTLTLAVTVDFQVVLAAGTVQRLGGGLPSVNNRVTFYADVAAQDGSEIAFSLFRDGLDVPGGTTVTGRGIGNKVLGSFAIINGTPVPGDPVYSVKASKITGAAADVELSNVRFILEVVPTLGV